jgi:hypothetical protein
MCAGHYGRTGSPVMRCRYPNLLGIYEDEDPQESSHTFSKALKKRVFIEEDFVFSYFNIANKNAF